MNFEANSSDFEGASWGLRDWVPRSRNRRDHVVAHGIDAVLCGAGQVITTTGRGA